MVEEVFQAARQQRLADMGGEDEDLANISTDLGS